MNLIKTEKKKDFHRGVWESPSISEYEIKSFFEKLTENKEIEIFVVWIDERRTLENKNGKKLIEITEGASLHIAKKLEKYLNQIIKTRNGAMYHIEYNGGYYGIGEGPCSKKCSCSLTRLSTRIDLKEVKESYGGSLIFPGKSEVSKFYFAYDEYDPIRQKKWSASFFFYGKGSLNDRLFKKTYNFLMQEIKKTKLS